jgi:hypothetical protein
MVMVQLATVFGTAALYMGIARAVRRKYELTWRNILAFSILFSFGFLLLNRFVIIYMTQDESWDGLSGVEKLSISLISTFQSFGLDADYATFVTAGKTLCRQSGPYGEWLANIYGAFLSLLHVAAPVFSGAVLLDILTDLFPSLRLRLVYRTRPKYVFSELNDGSLCLASDILAKGTLDSDGENQPNYVTLQRFWGESDGKGTASRQVQARPVIVFTDAYVNDEDEKRAELLAGARELGAICLQDDLLHLNLGHSKLVNYFFMDENDQNNITALSKLLSLPWVKDMIDPQSDGKAGTSGASKLAEHDVRLRCYVFSNSQNAKRLVANIAQQLEGSRGEGGRAAISAKTDANIVIRVINNNETMALNLMSRVPLYYPLYQTEAKHPAAASDQPGTLTVTILGEGDIAQEVFNAVFWCGQLSRYRLHINVCSNYDGAERESPMKKRLKRQMPELLESCREHSDLLNVYEVPPAAGQMWNPVYARLAFYNCDVESGGFYEDYPNVIHDTDYFVVALGSDETNITTAQELHLYLERKRIREQGADRHRVIACAVCDPALSGAVRQSGDTDLISFGSDESLFSCRNVFMSGLTPNSLQRDTGYSIQEYHQDKEDIYKSASNMARKLHLCYKLFDAGLISKLSLSEAGVEPIFKPMGELADCLLDTGTEQAQTWAWVEHRRWNAYLRTKGFCSVPKTEPKDVFHKLHPCLVEAAVPASETAGTIDHLDAVSIEQGKMELSQGGQTKNADGNALGYKTYDYPEYDFDQTALVHQPPQFLNIDSISDYVSSRVQSGGRPVWAKKCVTITARPGTPGEEVVTHTSTGLVETVNRVTVDEATGTPDWVVTNPRGERYLVRDCVFRAKYQPVSGSDGLYRPTGQAGLALQIEENIVFSTPWGEMKLARGGYLMIPADGQIYGIQADDFEKTYEILDDAPRDTASYLREALT